MLNDVLLTYPYHNIICEKYNFENFKFNIDDINETKTNIPLKIFEETYIGDYNTELLNKCIKYKLKNILDYLLKTKQINFDNETFRQALYAKNIDVVKHMLENKYMGSDKDLLVVPPTYIYFFKELLNLYKKYNILISDDVYKEFRINSKPIEMQYCINGDNKEHMDKLNNEVEIECKKIFPFDTYHNNTDYGFYYDMAKRGDLTLNIISKIHHVVGAEGIKHLVKLYMEFNNIQNNQNQNNKDKIEENTPKKIVKKIVKKVVKKVTEHT